MGWQPGDGEEVSLTEIIHRKNTFKNIARIS